MTTLLAAVVIALATPPSWSADDPSAADLIAAHNKERAERKLPPLVAEPRLTAAAKAHAADMASHTTLSHDGSDGSTLVDRVKRQKYDYLKTGENVAYGQTSVESVTDVWMNSPHHRENILGDFTEIGVGRVEADDGTPYWCVDFGRPFPRLDPDKAEEELAERLNHARADASMKALRVAPKLAKAARAIAADYAANGPPRSGDAAKDKEKEKKDEPKAPDPMERIKQSGYRYMRLTETGTFGTPTPEETLKALVAIEAEGDPPGQGLRRRRHRLRPLRRGPAVMGRDPGEAAEVTPAALPRERGRGSEDVEHGPGLRQPLAQGLLLAALGVEDDVEQHQPCTRRSRRTSARPSPGPAARPSRSWPGVRPLG